MLTGITRICKESIFSDLNNIDVVTQTSTKYETAFGFTEEEVKVGLARVGLLDYREKVKEWYDGFTFGQRRDMYNPWSITKFIDAEGIFDIYWANTSNNKLVSSLIRKSSKNMKMAMEQLLEGEMLHVRWTSNWTLHNWNIGNRLFSASICDGDIYAVNQRTIRNMC